MKPGRLLGPLALTTCGLVACWSPTAREPEQPLDAHVGLNLEVADGVALPLSVRDLSDHPERRFYVEQLRVFALQNKFPAPDALDFLTAHSDFSALDWSGAAKVQTVVEKREGSSSGYRESRFYLLAAWMREAPRFELSFLDEAGNPVGEPIGLDESSFLMRRQVAMAWTDGQLAPGDDGPNRGDTSKLTVSSSGTFTGASDEIFVARVKLGGGLGTATVDLTDVRGLTLAKDLLVTSGQPLVLDATRGSAELTFTGSGNAVLVAGDSWRVRCSAATGKVSAPEAGSRATFGALAELRYAKARRGTPLFTIPEGARRYRLGWVEKPRLSHEGDLAVSTEALDYGLSVKLAASPPQNGSFYQPGEELTVSVELFDRSGQRLHPAGSLPTYADFMAGRSAGISYFKSDGLPAGFGFFKEHRINLAQLGLVGPYQRATQGYPGEAATGLLAVIESIPSNSKVITPGATDPSKWATPIASSVKLKVPDSAEAGTYAVVGKWARSWLGERVYRMETLSVQVGSAERTDFPRTVGNCDLCHTRDAALTRMRHGLAESQLCVACHARASNTVPELVHRIHFFSMQYPERKASCAACHITVGSNERASYAVCGSCHNTLHPGEYDGFAQRPYENCGAICHAQQPTGGGHTPLAPN